MKTRITAALSLVACFFFTLTSCEKEFGEMAKEAAAEATFEETFKSPLEGEVANKKIQLKELHTGAANWHGESPKADFEEVSIWGVSGGENLTAETTGCFPIEGNQVVGTDLSVYWLTDSVTAVSMSFSVLEDEIDFRNRVTPTHIIPTEMCFGGGRVTVRARSVNDSNLIAVGEWYGLVRVTDTVTIITHDTTYIHTTDTVHVHDTMVNDLMISVTAIHDSWDGVTTAGINGTNHLQVVKTDAAGNVIASFNLTYHQRHPFSDAGFDTPFDGGVQNNCYTYINGQANCLGHVVSTTIGQGQVVENTLVGTDGINYTAYAYAFPVSAARQCFGTDLVTTCHFVGADGAAAGTYSHCYDTIAVVPPTPTRELVSTDTSWVCGTANNGVYTVLTNTVSYQVTRTGTITRHYNLAPLSETEVITATATYTYVVAMTGTAYVSMMGSTVMVNNDAADFGGFVVTLTPGVQNFCPLTQVSATLTANSVVFNGTYNGVAVTAEVPVTVNPNPTPATPLFEGVLYAFVTTSYTTNISITPEHWAHVLCFENGQYVWYYGLWQAGMTRSSFSSQTISAAEYTVVANAVATGQGMAKVYHHSNDGATFCLGTVKGTEQSGNQWKVKYYNLTGSLENMMEFSASTFSGYNGEDPIRGIMAANGSLSADGITLQIQ